MTVPDAPRHRAEFASTVADRASAARPRNPLPDATHDPELRSWVESANDGATDFPLQNLPYGRFRRSKSGEPWRIGVAIGDQILDLRLAVAQCPWPEAIEELLTPLAAGDLNAFMALGTHAWRVLRHALSIALTDGSDLGPFLELCLLPQAQAELSLPCRIGEFTDFHVGIHHALAIGRLFRPDRPLRANYKWLPIASHGRASSIVVSGQGVRRPHGQIKSADGTPVHGPTGRLGFELQFGALVGPPSALGEPVAMADAESHLFGLVLLNDWSARDIQAWESQPLGPFLGRNFATTLSPWVVTMDALAPFRRRAFERTAGDPQPLPYLDSAFNRDFGAVAVAAGTWLQTRAMRDAGMPPQQLSTLDFADAAYWTLAQLVAHHTANGCNLRTGDLLGTGPLSGPAPSQAGSLIELTDGGRRPLALPDGQTRVFLQDGDTVMLRAACQAEGFARIGFGEAGGTVLG